VLPHKKQQGRIQISEIHILMDESTLHRVDEFLPHIGHYSLWLTAA